MMRQAIRGLMLLGFLVLVSSTGQAQLNNPDEVEVRDRKDGSTKKLRGHFRVGPAGFQVFTGEKFDKPGEAFSPDDIVKVTIGDLPGVNRDKINSANGKEGKGTRKDFDEARTIYQELLKELPKKAPDARSKRYLEFKFIMMTNKVVDGLDAGDAWEKQADECIGKWSGFLSDYKTGWELWPATRACTRLQIERGKYKEASETWKTLTTNPEMPADSKLEARLQVIDAQIRAKNYASASVNATELLKTAAGARKDRLTIYKIAAKAGIDNKPLDAVAKIQAEIDKTKEVSVRATGYTMIGEMYLVGGKPRDAMWAFLWVETVFNQDKNEVHKAIVRLTELFAKHLKDEDRTRAYEEKIKQFRTTF
ncbi:MAG: hypothetical protein L0241_18600 [Planctomycetia bacterium]|nr:hypothetical protein [Planctomycetia bacterium]